MNQDTSKIIIIIRKHLVELNVIDDSIICNNSMLINGENFNGMGTSFSGFHDWIHENEDIDKSQKILGVELFPFDDNIKEKLTPKGVSSFSQGAILINFTSSASELKGFSGGEQAFGFHQYFQSTYGTIAIVLDVDDFNEKEFQNLYRSVRKI